jgi:hypothetical protein
LAFSFSLSSKIFLPNPHHDKFIIESSLTMEVIPIAAPNSAFAFRRVRIRTLFIINDRLDETPLKNALTALIRDHWRLLGARILGDLKKPQLFYHLPDAFPDDYELFKWSSEDVDSAIDKAIPQLKPSPSQTGKVTVLPIDVRSLVARFLPREWPFHLSDAQGEPFLLVKITLFADATVFGISIPHVVCDALGLGSIIRAWLGLVEGKTPPTMIGTREDFLPGQKPFAEYAKAEVTAKGQTRLKGRFDGVLVPLGFVPQLVRNSKEVGSVLLFPTGVVQRLRERIVQGFVERGDTDPGLTSSDVITAILAKVCVRVAVCGCDDGVDWKTQFSRMDTKKKHMLSLSQTVNCACQTVLALVSLPPSDQSLQYEAASPSSPTPKPPTATSTTVSCTPPAVFVSNMTYPWAQLPEGTGKALVVLSSQTPSTCTWRFTAS